MHLDNFLRNFLGGFCFLFLEFVFVEIFVKPNNLFLSGMVKKKKKIEFTLIVFVQMDYFILKSVANI